MNSNFNEMDELQNLLNEATVVNKFKQTMTLYNADTRPAEVLYPRHPSAGNRIDKQSGDAVFFFSTQEEAIKYVVGKGLIKEYIDFCSEMNDRIKRIEKEDPEKAKRIRLYIAQINKFTEDGKYPPVFRKIGVHMKYYGINDAKAFPEFPFCAMFIERARKSTRPCYIRICNVPTEDIKHVHCANYKEFTVFKPCKVDKMLTFTLGQLFSKVPVKYFTEFDDFKKFLPTICKNFDKDLFRGLITYQDFRKRLQWSDGKTSHEKLNSIDTGEEVVKESFDLMLNELFEDVLNESMAKSLGKTFATSVASGAGEAVGAGLATLAGAKIAKKIREKNNNEDVINEDVFNEGEIKDGFKKGAKAGAIGGAAVGTAFSGMGYRDARKAGEIPKGATGKIAAGLVAGGVAGASALAGGAVGATKAAMEKRKSKKPIDESLEDLMEDVYNEALLRKKNKDSHEDEIDGKELLKRSAKMAVGAASVNVARKAGLNLMFKSTGAQPVFNTKNIAKGAVRAAAIGGGLAAAKNLKHLRRNKTKELAVTEGLSLEESALLLVMIENDFLNEGYNLEEVYNEKAFNNFKNKYDEFKEKNKDKIQSAKDYGKLAADGAKDTLKASAMAAGTGMIVRQTKLGKKLQDGKVTGKIADFVGAGKVNPGDYKPKALAKTAALGAGMAVAGGLIKSHMAKKAKEREQQGEKVNEDTLYDIVLECEMQLLDEGYTLHDIYGEFEEPQDYRDLDSNIEQLSDSVVATYMDWQKSKFGKTVNKHYKKKRDKVREKVKAGKPLTADEKELWERMQAIQAKRVATMRANKAKKQN